MTPIRSLVVCRDGHIELLFAKLVVDKDTKCKHIDVVRYWPKQLTTQSYSWLKDAEVLAYSHLNKAVVEVVKQYGVMRDLEYRYYVITDFITGKRIAHNKTLYLCLRDALMQYLEHEHDVMSWYQL